MPGKPLAVGLPVDPASARQVAHAILSRAEFAQPPENPVEWVEHWIEHELARLSDAALSGRWSTVGGLALLGIVGLAIWLIVRTFRVVQRDRSVDGVVVGGGRRAPAEWLAEAMACERRGDWRAALRARYRALVAELARRGLLDEIDGRTSGEYRVAVNQAAPMAADEFAGATDLFEVAVYGDGPAGPAESTRIQEFADRVLARTR